MQNDKTQNQLSTVVVSAEQAMSIKYNTYVYELKHNGKKVIVMSLGEAFFDIPLFDFNSLRYPELYHYSHSRGIPELREKISAYFLKQYDIPFNYETEILITAGSKAAIHFTLMAILNPGDEVLVPEPAWVSYPEQIKLCYGKPVQVPYYQSVYDFEKYITAKTKAIIINTPHNPTGYIYKRDELIFLLNLCEKYNLWLLSDEAYSDFAPDGEFVSPGSIDREKKHTIIFNSISKNYGISGWRLGYVIAKEQVIFNVLKINQHLVTCPATILEYYVEKYFEDILRVTLPQIKELLKKREIIAAYMAAKGLSFLPGNATFYFFVSISPSNLTSEEFCTRLLFDSFIATVPGLGYGKSCDEFIRVSIGSASTEEIFFGLDKIQLLIHSTSTQPSSKKQALVIGGGVWQVPLINKLKDRGYSVSVADPYDFSEGVKIADFHVKADVRDWDTIDALTKEIKYEFIVSDQSDISVNTVAQLSKQRHLLANPPEVVELFVNKVKMRKFAKSIAVPVPHFTEVTSIDELVGFLKAVNCTVMLKPADSQSSRGVFKIENFANDSIEHLFVKSMRFSNCGSLIAEEFIDGFEITVEGIANNYKHRTLAVSRKKHFRPSIASDLEYPAQLPDWVHEKVIELNNLYVEKSGLNFGITHAEYMLSADYAKIVLIEIACRGGGSLISSDIIQWVSGVNVYNVFLDSLQGKIVDVNSFGLTRKNALLHFFEFPTGKVKRITGVNEIKNLSGVHYFKLSFSEGDLIKPAEDDRSRQGMVILFDDTAEKIATLLVRVNKLLVIEYE